MSKDLSRWITTLEAATLSGWSQPFVERLLGTGGYQGEILWSPANAQPTVRADEWQAWVLVLSEASDPGDLEKIRTEAILDDVPSKSRSSAMSKDAARARARELAKVRGKR